MRLLLHLPQNHRRAAHTRGAISHHPHSFRRFLRNRQPLRRGGRLSRGDRSDLRRARLPHAAGGGTLRAESDARPARHRALHRQHPRQAGRRHRRLARHLRLQGAPAQRPSGRAGGFHERRSVRQCGEYRQTAEPQTLLFRSLRTGQSGKEALQSGRGLYPPAGNGRRPAEKPPETPIFA